MFIMPAPDQGLKYVFFYALGAKNAHVSCIGGGKW